MLIVPRKYLRSEFREFVFCKLKYSDFEFLGGCVFQLFFMDNSVMELAKNNGENPSKKSQCTT